MNKNRRYNYLGEDITDKALLIRKEDYIRGFSEGKFLINWPEPSDDVDGYGFDKRYSFYDGCYFKLVALEKGTILCRYGSDKGIFVAPIDTPYEQLSLPYVKETIEYHSYEVIPDILVVSKPLIVKEGKIYPCFDQEGGGTQYVLPESVKKCIEHNSLKEVFYVERND